MPSGGFAPSEPIQLVRSNLVKVKNSPNLFSFRCRFYSLLNTGSGSPLFIEVASLINRILLPFQRHPRLLEPRPFFIATVSPIHQKSLRTGGSVPASPRTGYETALLPVQTACPPH